MDKAFFVQISVIRGRNQWKQSVQIREIRATREYNSCKLVQISGGNSWKQSVQIREIRGGNSWTKHFSCKLVKFVDVIRGQWKAFFVQISVIRGRNPC